MRIVLSAILLFFNLVCLGQFSEKEQRQIDSLNVLLNSQEVHDTSIAGSYLALSEILYVSNLDTMLYLCEEASKIINHSLENETNEIVIETQKINLALALNNMAYVYGDKGLITKSLEMFHQSLKIQEELNNQEGISTCLNNIGYMYRLQKEYESAIDYYTKSLAIDINTGNKKSEAYSYNNIAAILELKGNYNEALKYCKKSLLIRQELGDKYILAYSLNFMGSLYERFGDLDSALYYDYESLKLQREVENKKGIIYCLDNIGTVALMMNNMKLAQESAVEAISIANELGVPNLIRRAAGLNKRVARKLSNYQKALEMYELEITMKDSIQNDNNQKEAIRLQTKYEFEKEQLLKEQQLKEKIRNQKLENERRNNLQYSIILVAILVVFGFVLALSKINISPKFAEGLIFFAFLIFFEFLLVLTDPYIDNWTGGAPAYKLLINAFLAAAIFPAHALFETLLKQKIINKSIQ